MDGYVTAFDRARSRIGFAASQCSFNTAPLAGLYPIPGENRPADGRW